MRRDGGGLRQMTGAPLPDLIYPAWSPNGHRFAASNAVKGVFVLEFDGGGAK